MFYTPRLSHDPFPLTPALALRERVNRHRASMYELSPRRTPRAANGPPSRLGSGAGRGERALTVEPSVSEIEMLMFFSTEPPRARSERIRRILQSKELTWLDNRRRVTVGHRVRDAQDVGVWPTRGNGSL